MAVTVDEVRAVARSLERAYEVVVRGRLTFRVGSIVFLAFSQDMAGSAGGKAAAARPGDRVGFDDSVETMGLGFPKDWRAAAVESRPETFSLPRASDLRFDWIVARLAALDHDEMVDLVEDAWALCVPKFLVARRRALPLRDAARRGDSASP